MKQGILIFGPSGAGKSTLGRLTAQRMHFLFVDIDDYIWRQDTQIPFSQMYSREEKIRLLGDAIKTADRFVMAGSMDSFHQHFDPFFSLAVFLYAPAQLRVARVDRREREQFGARVLLGGDMAEEHQRFLRSVASYDTGMQEDGPTLQKHMLWAEQLPCPLLKLNGEDPLLYNAQKIEQAYWAALDGLPIR